MVNYYIKNYSNINAKIKCNQFTDQEHGVNCTWLNLWECIHLQSRLIAIIVGYIYMAMPLWVSNAVHAVFRQQVLSALRPDPLIRHTGWC